MQIIKFQIALLAIVWFIIAVPLLFSSAGSAPFIAFLVFAALERFWEVFFTAKQNVLARKSRFDWLFVLIAFTYLILMYLVLGERLFFGKTVVPELSILGLLIFVSAMFLRLWAVRSLGFGWESFISSRPIKVRIKPKIVRTGPYHLMRHPMYLGTILETLSIPLVLGSYFSFIFAVIVCAPLLVTRAKLEEKESLKKFRKDYARYIKATGFLWPRLPGVKQ
ncbi:MAG: isoprenylcysteine carboxylmethyltransferase family protein [Candidatus Omnitrophica bacterium]|nr:isoprenylcysteine carboxylmethyltransferase family protein [Candidatus Omnitrophota bacterium]